jgi:pimeloyl-ACP methyl ester carboxylesterase
MKLITLGLAALISVMTSSAQAQSDVSRDAATYGALPYVSEAAISPDGRTIAQIQSVGGGKRAVVFLDLDGGKAPVGMGLENAKARDLVWAGPDHVMLLVSAAVKESFGDGLKTYEIWRWFLIDREARRKSVLFKSGSGYFYFLNGGSIRCVDGLDPNMIVMSLGGSQYTVDLRTGSEKPRASIKGANGFLIYDSDCNPAVDVEWDSKKEELKFSLPGAIDQFKLKSVMKMDEEAYESVDDFGFLGKPDEIGAIGLDGEFLALRRINVTKGSFTEEGLRISGLDIGSTIVDPFSNEIVGVRYVDDLPRAKFFAGRLNDLQQTAAKAFPDASAVVKSWSRDLTRIVIEVNYPDHPDQFFLFEPEKKAIGAIGSTYPKLDGRLQPRRRKFDYVASDGIEVQGYLTDMPGASENARPLIVLPHGGPEARDNLKFDWWASFYAANGYLVYQPNFRGSFGYGEAFRRSGDGQWGRKMQDDISEGVRRLTALGTVDPARVCIVGASYGGYAALAGATLTPDLYACAVSVNGVSNLPTLIASESDSAEKYWTKRIGSIFKDKAAIEAVSPAKQVSKKTPPILLVVSSEDIVVPPGQSLIMRRALEGARRPVEMVTLKNEDHWLSNEATRIEMLEKSLDFINRHIGPK